MAGNQSQDSFEFIHCVSVCEYQYTPNYCTYFCYRKLVESSIPSDATPDGVSPTATTTIVVTNTSMSISSTTFTASTRTSSIQSIAASTTTTEASATTTEASATTTTSLKSSVTTESTVLASSSADVASNSTSQAAEITSDASLLSSQSRIGIGVGVALGVLGIIIGAFLFFRWRRSATRDAEQVVQQQPHIGELDGNVRTSEKSARYPPGTIQAYTPPIFELPAYSQPAEIASGHETSSNPHQGTIASTTAPTQATNERDPQKRHSGQGATPQPHVANARDSTISSVLSMTSNISEMEGTSCGSSMVVSPRQSDDVEALMQRHSQLEARRRRMVELQMVEEQQAQIEAKLNKIASGRLQT